MKGDAGGLMLRAVSLSFDHPRTGKRVMFDVPGFNETASKVL
jgi:hypothetical protein